MLYELIYKLKLYQRMIIGINKMRWKDDDERSTADGHRVYYSRSADKHEHGVGLIVNSTVSNSVMECQAVSTRIIIIRLKATLFNVTIIQVYAPDYSDEETDEFYDQLQKVV